MKVVICNLSKTFDRQEDFHRYWTHRPRPEPPRERQSLFDFPVGWGFHIFALGMYLLDRGLADEVEFWTCDERREMFYQPSGILWVRFLNVEDIQAYIEVSGPPDLFINYGVMGHPVLRYLEDKSFRVHVPCLRTQAASASNRDAECYLVDDRRFLDDRSMLYIPVVNTRRIRPVPREKRRDFIYLANVRCGKRHDILLRAVRGTGWSGHLHPVEPGELDLTGTRITTSGWNQADVLELMCSSRMAVYPGDYTSNPAAMWECVAAGLPVVVNRQIKGGAHVVVPGATGELARERGFRRAMRHVLKHMDEYQPRAHLEQHWEPVQTLEKYLAFFAQMGWSAAATT